MPLGIKRKEITSDHECITLVVNKSRCPQNHVCPSIKVCPVGALTQVGFSAPTVAHDKCIRCGKCVRFCPRLALSLE